VGEENGGTLRRIGFEAATRIDRHDSGVSWQDYVPGGGVVVGNEIELQLDLEAILDDDLAATGAIEFYRGAEDPPERGPGRDARGALTVPLSRWRPGAPRLVRLLVGLWIFGVGEGLVVASELGNSPWSVFAEGLAVRTPLTVGTATVAVSFALLALWVPLGVRPGLGTLLNAVLVGLAMDATLWLVAPATLGVRVGELAVGIGLVGVGSGFYLGAALGPGPRDGLMTGLHERTGRSVALIRTASSSRLSRWGRARRHLRTRNAGLRPPHRPGGGGLPEGPRPERPRDDGGGRRAG